MTKTEAQQPIFVSTEPTNRNVIIEDFTGRGCGFCPDGHRIANQIASNYPDRVWPVYIHAENYYSPTSYPNLNTVVGQQFHNGFTISGYPSGLINRSTSNAIDRGQWSNYTNQQLAQSAECNIAGAVDIDPLNRLASIIVEVYYTDNSNYSENYLTVVMLQDSILGSQSDFGNYNPSQWFGDQYVHLHALRDIITENDSVWGDPISPTTQGTLITRTFTYQIPETIGDPNGVEVDLNNIYFLAWVTETYDGTPTRPILNACKLIDDPYTHYIAATVYPAIGGTVSGSGTYHQGDTCTLSAVPNEGFEFLNWTENGEVVSTDNVYSFVITGAVSGHRSIVAHFHSLNPNNIVFADSNVEAICVAHWDTDGDGGLSYEEATAVTDLGGAFYNTNITSFDELQYFTGLTSIEEDAFEYCSNLNSIVFPEGITSIGDYAFYSCNSLSGNLTIPNSVTSIGSWAFGGCTSFNGTLTLSSTLTWISHNAFDGCSFTGDLTIPNSVEYIGVGAFRDCHGFTGTLTIGTGVTKIGVSAFRRCTGITAVQYNAINWQVLNGDDYEGDWYNLSDFMDYPIFNECGNLISVAIGEQVQNIPAYAFYHCSSFLGEITLPESLVSVGYYAFAGCDEITTINYNATNCTVMGSAQYPVFYDCISIQHIYIGENVQSIPNYAFKRCFNVTDMSVAAVIPPTIGISTFATIPRNIPVSVPHGSGDAYSNAPYWEEFFNINEIYFNDVQIVSLSQGWNWWSTNLDITLEDLKAALVEALPGSNITIKSRTQNTAYNPNTNRWRGTLNSLDVTQMYMISVSANCEVTLSGTHINPAEHPVIISNGSNWIAFPLAESMTVSDAFAGFAVNGDKVKSRSNNTQYNGISWRGQLTTLVPGQGYMYISNAQEPRTLTFPVSTK